MNWIPDGWQPDGWPPEGWLPGQPAEPINCYLQTATLLWSLPNVIFDVKFRFVSTKRAPTFVSADFDNVVVYAAGLPPTKEVAYQFSNDRKFTEDQLV